jgi:hypothetical protein
MQQARKTWQAMTALVSLSASGTVAGFSLVPKALPELTSPASVPVRLMALQQAVAQQPGSDEMLRAAIVNVARYYLRLAATRTPAEMERLIWERDSLDGTDHGESCAAFASLTLELGAQVVGLQSWVTGGSTYPWPLHSWADVRVDPNPGSLSIVSILQDAQAHGRWHPLGDGYVPRPGDWVLFDGHVEVVTSYSAGVLHTIGGDSLPNFSVNAHSYRDPLAAAGVQGFVDNGGLRAEPASPRSHGQRQASRAHRNPGRAHRHPDRAHRRPGGPRLSPRPGQDHGDSGDDLSAAIPGLASSRPAAPAAGDSQPGAAAVPGLAPGAAGPGTAAGSRAPGHRHGHSAQDDAPAAGTPGVLTAADREAFIRSVAAGAVASQRRYGVPAAVTIAQAILESDWGRSALATRDHNLFGMKGTGPAGSDSLPTREYSGGRWVSTIAPFRVYRDIAQSLDDHGRLLATSGYYTAAMAHRRDPDAFAAALTGVYATDPSYGAELIALMREYDLYRYDAAPGAPRAAAPHAAPAHGAVRHSHRDAAMAHGAAIPGLVRPWSPAPVRSARHRHHRATIPLATLSAFVSSAKVPLQRQEALYRDVAAEAGLRWQLLAACDWMQCRARPRYSPVHGERLGTLNPDGTCYRTKSEALWQCADDLISLAGTVYGLDVTGGVRLSVSELAEAFAAFRWGALLRDHRTSAMEFPYSVAGLSEAHLSMRWPRIDHPGAPDRPGARFRGRLGAVPVVLLLRYPVST